MISKAVLCHILVIWGLAQITVQANRPSIPAAVRSSMIANGWRPLTAYEGKSGGSHSSNNNGGLPLNERHSGPHPVHGKLHEHMATSEKMNSKHNKNNKQTHEYTPPNILGSFSVFGHSVAKSRPEAPKSHIKQVTSETREFSFLVPPPREPVRYDIDPYRKVILRDNEAYLRQPQQYVISHPVGPAEIRNPQYYQKGGLTAASNNHALTATQNRPVITEYSQGVQQPPRQQQHVPFESLKLSNGNLYLQPPTANGPLNFGHEQQASDNLYEQYPSSVSPHGQQLSQEGGNFYSQVNHPSPSYKSPNLERDPSFLVHESHEVSYATPAPTPGLGAYSNFRPSSPYESLHPPERHSTTRPTQSNKFVPSKTDNMRQQLQNYGQYSHNGNPGLDNSIVSSEPNYSNGIANTYYISEQQSLTPPAPTWSIPVKSKVAPDINEVLPKTSRPPKFNVEPATIEPVRQNIQQIHNYLFPRPELQQQQFYPSNPLALINQQQPETIFETPESISLKHFNEQQYRLQQQLLQRDRERLREQELQRQQIELERIAAAREREKQATEAPRPSQETPRPPVEYIDTTLSYVDSNNQEEDIRKIPNQQFVHEEYQEVPFESTKPDVNSGGVSYETENVSFAPEVFTKVTSQTEKPVTQEISETPSSGYRTRPRKPTTASSVDHQQQQHRRRKPTTPSYDDHSYRQEEQYHLSTLSPKPIVQSPGTLYSHPSTTQEFTTPIQVTSFPTVTTIASSTSTTTAPTTTTTTTTTTPTPTTTTTQRPRTRRPIVSNGSSGRRRRPTTTTTQEPETTTLPESYRLEDFTKYEKTETEASRRRRVKPTTPASTQRNHYESLPTTSSTEKKRFEIQNYGHKLGGKNEQEYVTDVSSESYNVEVEQVSPQKTYAYTNEQEALYYTPSYDSQFTTGQESSEYETSGYPTGSTSLTHASPTERENLESTEIGKSVYTNIPLEELFVHTERPVPTTTVAPIATTTTTTTTTARPATVSPTRNTQSRTTGIPATSSEMAHTTRPSSHRVRPMRFGNSTRPRFSIKDYKTRLDYRNRMSSTTESPSSVTGRHKTGSKLHQDNENQTADATTGRYRHMSRVSYRITSTTPSYHSRRGDSNASSTTERINKFTPKRRLHNNHLYRSKISTTTVEPAEQDADVTTGTSTRHSSVRNENVFSASIRRRPVMKHSVFTQSSDIRTTRKDATEMVPEETSFYSTAMTQLLGGPSKDFTPVDSDDKTDHVIVVSEENNQVATTTSETEIPTGKNDLEETDKTASDESHDSTIPIRVEDTNVFEYSPVTTVSTSEPAGQTEALVKTDDDHVTVNSQLEEDLFARASQSVADLTSSASALYDKPGMFKAVSVAPSAAEGGAIISSRFKINQDKPTLPIEAFFHELSNQN